MKVAILIPTMNRPDFIERTVGYYNSLNSPHPIYIGDASDPVVAAQTAKILERFRNVEVKYFHWQGLDAPRTVVGLAERVNDECQFCSISGDDDYFVPSSLTQCAKFLAENKDYRTVQGRAAAVELDRPGAYGEIKGLSQYWTENSLEQETSLGRVESIVKKYFVLQFSVHRTDEFIEDCRHYKEIKDYSLGELFHCILFAIRGKSKFLDCLFLIRSLHAGRFDVPEDIRSPDNFFNWSMRPHWSSDIKKCLDFLSLALHESGGMSLDQAKQIITKALVEKFQNKRGYLSRIKSILPVELTNPLRPLHNLTLKTNDMRLLRSKRSRFYEEFLHVSNSLSGWPQKTYDSD